MHERFNREMLTLARSLREFTQQDLAKAVGTTQGRLSKVEHGLIDPPLDLIMALSRALGVPEDFFYQEGHMYTLPIRHHRRRKQVGKKALDRVHAEITVRLLNIAEFLRSADLQSSYAVPEIDLDENEWSPEQVAQQIRQQWSVPRGPIPNLTELLERAGVMVVPCDFGGVDVDAIGMRVADLPPVMFINANIPTDRMRFTLAHELGHLVMHSLPRESMEVEANRFAGEFLMPEADIRPQLHPVTLPLLATLKRVWRVSMGAILERAKALRTISATAYAQLRRIMASNGWNRREPPELDLAPETPTALAALIGFHREALGFGLPDLGHITRTFVDEFRRRYLAQEPQRLRLVG